jgi:CysZ protein
MNLVLFSALDGYLLGPEYFEVVALRRLDARAARAMRNRCGGGLFGGGVALARPFARARGLRAAPVVATALIVHPFAALPCPEPHALTRYAV